jgi:poly(A)-specific ribonuclease
MFQGLRFIFEALAGGELKSIDPKWFCIDENGDPAFIDIEAKNKEVHEIQKSLKEKTHVIVGHNLFTDLAFLYKIFVGGLPDDVCEFQHQIHHIFPHVIDTKYMFTYDNGSMHSNDRLADIYGSLKLQTVPFIVLGEKHSSYSCLGKEHEAGYDSMSLRTPFIHARLTSP